MSVRWLVGWSYFRISILSASLTLDLTKRRDDMVTNNLADVVADMAVEKVADLLP